jgi:hypothetical protein
MQLFKKNLDLFFAHENIKKRASKVAHNRPQLFFHKDLAAQTSPELIFHIINMSQNSSVSLSVVVTRQPVSLSGEFSATQAQREVVKILFFIFPTGLEVYLEDMF